MVKYLIMSKRNVNIQTMNIAGHNLNIFCKLDVSICIKSTNGYLEQETICNRLNLFRSTQNLWISIHRNSTVDVVE